MKSKFIILIFLFSLSFVSSLTYYKLDLTYDNNNLILNSFKMEITSLEKENSFGFWIAEISDFNNDILNLTFFDVGNQVFWDGIDSETGEINFGGIKNLDKVNFTLSAPYYENASKIILYDDSLNQILEIDVSMYSKVTPSEISKDLFLLNQTESEIEFQETHTPKSQIKSFQEELSEKWWILAIVLAILIIILIKSLSSKKFKQSSKYQNT